VANSLLQFGTLSRLSGRVYVVPNCDLPFIRPMSLPTNSGHVSWPTRLTKGMTPLAHPQEMPEISVQLGAWIHPPPPPPPEQHPQLASGHLWASQALPAAPEFRRDFVRSRRATWAPEGLRESERALQVPEPSESPAAITTQPLVSAANTVVAIGSA
jgi:hypothetical protein